MTIGKANPMEELLQDHFYSDDIVWIYFLWQSIAEHLFFVEIQKSYAAERFI